MDRGWRMRLERRLTALGSAQIAPSERPPITDFPICPSSRPLDSARTTLDEGPHDCERNRNRNADHAEHVRYGR